MERLQQKTVLVLGITGMLGNAVFRVLSKDSSLAVFGTARSAAARNYFPDSAENLIFTGVDILDTDSLLQVFSKIRPNIVINCIGLIKQLADANDPLNALPVNSILPHRLSRLCATTGARLVHISTDCVFRGDKGMYRESDISDAEDLYGKSKFIGELHDDPHAITLRTSIIGPELNSANGLVGWFLAQEGSVKGFRKAVFSGLPTVELANIIRDYVISRPELNGLYHVSSAPIDKFELLSLVKAEYGKHIEIVPDDSLVIDRSLDSTRFREATGYIAPDWPTLVSTMHSDM